MLRANAGTEARLRSLQARSFTGTGRADYAGPPVTRVRSAPVRGFGATAEVRVDPCAVESARSVALEYAAQQSAIERPFTEITKARFYADECASSSVHASVASGRAGAGALGLVSNATSGLTDHDGAEKRPLRGLLINRSAQRVKRMRTTVGHVARLLHFDAHCELAAQRWNKKFVTLTYADASGWRPGHFSAYRNAMRLWCLRRGVRARFVWVAELQKRGALHYHVVIWLPKGKYLPHADAQRWWPHGMTNIVTAQSPIGYIAKYASKTTAGEASGYPKGARMHGHGGLTPEGRRHVRYWNAPFWVRDALTGRADIRKVSGGYMDKLTGEFLPSPWRVCVGPGGQVWAYRIDQQEQEIAA